MKMKLLGWMHCKSKHSSTEPLKVFSTDNSAYFLQIMSFDELGHHAEPTFSYACFRGPNMKCPKFSNDTQANIAGPEEVSFNEVFQGFLAIGTLGMEPLNTEPPTPTFPEMFEHMTHEEMEMTENELKFINDKLEKFLEVEAEEVANRTSGRISNVSIITICNNQIEDANAEDYGSTLTYPLQNYLFGSSVELSKRELHEKKEKASLGELFKRNTVHEHLEGNYETVEKQLKEKHGKHFMKKMLKKLHSTSKTSRAPANGDASHSALTKRKLPKALKFFRRRVHPEELMSQKKVRKSCSNKIKRIFGNCGYQEGEDEEEKMLPQKANPAKKIDSLEMSPKGVSSNTSGAAREHWIKTDAKYLVLEL